MRDLEYWQEKLALKSAEEAIYIIGKELGSYARFSTSLGMEDQVITHLISHHAPDVSIFTIDTGRMFQETYDLLDLTRQHFHLPIATYFPLQSEVEKLVTTKGANSFYNSVEDRKECCHIRKVEPLKRALSGAKFWITGIRAEQSINRKTMMPLEWDEQYRVFKYHPLFYWTQQEVDDFIEQNKIPINTLHRKGFPSIGCAPCTRAVAAGEDPRSGRWWWEGSAKECGLHQVKLKAS